MKWSKYKKLNVLDLRKKLGWSQMEFALVLKIPRFKYVNIELKRRGATQLLQDQFALIRKSVEQMQQRGFLNRNTNPPWNASDLAMIQLRAAELDGKIKEMQIMIAKYKANVLLVHNRNRQVEAHVNILKKMNAPLHMIKGVESLTFNDKDLIGYYSLERLYLLEASLAAKKAEFAFLRKKLSTRP